MVGTKWARVDLRGWLSGNRPQVVPASCPELPGTRGPCWLPGAPQHTWPLLATRSPPACGTPAGTCAQPPLQGGTSESGAQGKACWCDSPTRYLCSRLPLTLMENGPRLEKHMRLPCLGFCRAHWRLTGLPTPSLTLSLILTLQGGPLCTRTPAM